MMQPLLHLLLISIRTPPRDSTQTGSASAAAHLCDCPYGLHACSLLVRCRHRLLQLVMEASSAVFRLSMHSTSTRRSHPRVRQRSRHEGCTGRPSVPSYKVSKSYLAGSTASEWSSQNSGPISNSPNCRSKVHTYLPGCAAGNLLIDFMGLQALGAGTEPLGFSCSPPSQICNATDAALPLPLSLT